jgi:hypothetical protein
VVIEAELSITLKVGESCININPAGVFIDGEIVLIKSGAIPVPGTGSNPDGADNAEPANRARENNNPNTEDIEYDGTVGGDNARHPLETEAAPPDIAGDDAIDFAVKDNDVEPVVAEADDGFGVDDTASMGLDMVPFVGAGKSFGQLISGTDLVTGEPVNRGMEAIGIFFGLVGAAGLIKGVMKGAAALKLGDKLGNAAQAVKKKAGEVVDVAKKKIKDFSDFKPQGLDVDPLSIPEGRDIMKELRKSNPEMGTKDIRRLAKDFLRSGKDAPIVRKAKPDEALYKVVPKNSEVTPYTPFFTSKKQLDALKKTPKDISETMGLPKASKATEYDIYKIKPKPGKTPKIFESTVAKTKEGLARRKGGGEQVIVPNRPDWTKAEKFGEM